VPAAPASPPARCVPPLAIHHPPPALPAVEAALAQALAWLLAAQRPDGSYGGGGNMLLHEYWANAEAHRSWQLATTGLTLEALLRHGGEADATRTAAGRALDWIVRHHDLHRCDDWDIDNVWGLLYGTEALAAAAAHPWFARGPRRTAIDAALRHLLARIAAYQSPNGGFGYYAEQIDAWRPQWATSFTTAAMVLAIDQARAVGGEYPASALAAARRAVARCRLPDGAMTYDVMALPAHDNVVDGINAVRGSLGRIAVCDLALLGARGGTGEPRPPDTATLVRGVDLFFRHHAYLDVARLRPTPHEAYHWNSGYFWCFGHFYVGELLPRLPPAERRDAAGKLAFEVMKAQERDGSVWDYWFADNTRAYGTAYAAMALGRARDALAAAAE